MPIGILHEGIESVVEDGVVESYDWICSVWLEKCDFFFGDDDYGVILELETDVSNALRCLQYNVYLTYQVQALVAW